MKAYKKPEIEVINFDSDDVIATSGFSVKKVFNQNIDTTYIDIFEDIF